ncbi:murein hydrolase activator EnvC family protein [Croceicoccus naphthovorans]|nr:peptidoglycan DD-metalloendopeptidase family protein [Croceicoccus naphthovorans]MBB3989937.1 septal ring factor EnvC (AmiA/AmiB activator) [Croceicoccus naphthovorans]
MRKRAFVLLLATLPAAAGAATTTEERLREVEAARAEAERQAAQFADQSRYIQDRALKAEARANALTAEIAEAESRLEAAQIRAATANNRLTVLRDDLAIKRAPLTRMLAALQRLARRPMLLLVMRPSSIRDFVRMRTMVAGLQPQIARATEDLRGDLNRSRRLAAAADKARADGERASRDLAERREELLAMGEEGMREAQSLADAANRAQREATLARGEARMIGDLVVSEREGRRTLAALAELPSPTLLTASTPQKTSAQSLPRLPVPGTVLAGFGERDAAGGRQKGITLAPAPGAPVVAPLAGKVAFAGPFRGYGTIVILRHAGGRTSLIAGLDRASVEIGREVRRGETLGNAPTADPRILYELRQGRRAIHPLRP